MRNRKVLSIALGVLLVGSLAFYAWSASAFNMNMNLTPNSSSVTGSTIGQALRAPFNTLSQATSDVCTFGLAQSKAFLDSKPEGAYLQGSCCSPMAYSHYVRQIEGLRTYSNITVIPRDPYNVSVALVKQMFAYHNAQLGAQQNATFAQALHASTEGLCCCQCWAWYFHEGLVKYLVLNYNLSATSLGNLLDLEDCCGGP